IKLVDIASHREAMIEEKEGEIQALKKKNQYLSKQLHEVRMQIDHYVKREQERKRVREWDKWMEKRKMELRKEFEMG
ncbi:hypothetical protein K440DRAFT_633100, partial [Wilcoxina mikolae CBS 423.85]